ncbi:MAG: hypothetical protein MPK62_00045 [Alphaproteobacteria bacterium]|nr:hypothetical protein [Alphaproteobacteria bacterium]MDA8029527.1 hypothetical protein [Alphaproteobacteria bacterium]
MPQSATADVNSAVVTYRAKLLAAYETGHWTNAVLFVNTINGLLPPNLKFKFGHESTRGTRYVICPAGESCTKGGEIPYGEDLIHVDRYYGGLRPSICGNRPRRYIECECGKRVYIDEGMIDIRVTQADLMDPNSIIKKPPSLAPPAPMQTFRDWFSMILPLIEDRCRKWREQVSIREKDGEIADMEEMLEGAAE